MRQSVLAFSVALAASSVYAGDFASNVVEFTEGNFATVGGSHYTNTAAALGKPSPIVSPGSAFAGILSPYNAHFEQTDLTAFARGGSLMLQFPSPVAVTGTPQIGIFTKISLFDMNYPNGVAGSSPQTDSMNEYGAERTAIVEVASNPADFRLLGRVIFDDPTNYYANASSPYQFPAPQPEQLASFDKPYAGSPADFASTDFAGALAQLNGSAGGTWVDIPTSIGLGTVQYLRLSDPLWRLPDGTLVESRPSAYFPPPNQFVKPADLFVDGAVLIPEPAGLAFIGVLIAGVVRRHKH